MKHAEMRQYFYSRLSSVYLQGELQALYHWCVKEIHSWSRPEVYLHNEESLDPSHNEKWMQVIERLIKNEPIQHIFGWTYFSGLKLHCDSRALIPRPETEELVALVLDREESDTLNIADLGCGSGCIALALKHHQSNWSVKGYDKSSKALDLARSNVTLTGLDVSLVELDLEDNISLDNVDVIVSNPPYIPLDLSNTIDDQVIKFEPKMALFSKADEPFFFFTRIAEIANRSGVSRVYFETHATEIDALKTQLQDLWEGTIEVVKDLSNKPRFIVLHGI